MLAAVPYVAMLSTISFSAGGGDAILGQAIAGFVFAVALWIMLALLITISAVMGEMPRRIVIISALLVPLAGITTVVAIDACSRPIKWAVIGPVLLPLLVVSLAVAARFPRLRAALSGDRFSFSVCGAIAVLSLVLLVAAAM